MLHLSLQPARAGSFEILCLGAHCDDIEIGCGATMLKLLRDYPGTSVHWVVFSSSPQRAREAKASAAKFLRRAARRRVITYEFRDGFFPYIGGEIKARFEELKDCVAPDLIFTSHRDDLHQDHRVIAELTGNTWREHLILEYEIPKYDGDLGAPNFFVPLPKSLVQRKVNFILGSYKSQRDKHWFDAETFWALMRLRGVECRSPSAYAEAFYAHKATLA